MGDDGLNYALNVNVTNMSQLMEALKRDVGAFEDEFNRWNHKNRSDHPQAAQIGADMTFAEGFYVRQNIELSVADAAVAMAMTKKALTLLALGAQNIGMVYKDRDDLARVKLSTIEDMFPDKPFKPGTTDADKAKLPPSDKWVPVGNEGWDINGDGKVDIKAPGGLGPQDKVKSSGTDEGGKPPGWVDPKTHAGYDPSFNVYGDPSQHSDNNSSGDNSLSNGSMEDLANMGEKRWTQYGGYMTNDEYYNGKPSA